ncbi:MAG: hypothetical protein Ct9H300mP28_18150 [Pseudomonadota bacterium]|nr:MAG: hypothetical protein Ct9H300mP28_18150 [Pseudomonadota bacterium]
MDLGVTKKVRPLIEAVREMVNEKLCLWKQNFIRKLKMQKTDSSSLPE